MLEPVAAPRRSLKPRLALSAMALAVALLLTGCICRGGRAGFPADQYEPNDTKEEATELTVGGTLDLSVNEGDPPDVIRFELLAGETVWLMFEHVDGGLLALEVLIEDPDGAETSFVIGSRYEDDLWGDPLEYTATASGTHYVTITDDWIGPPDALCMTGRLKYRLHLSDTAVREVTQATQATQVLAPVSSQSCAEAARFGFSS